MSVPPLTSSLAFVPASGDDDPPLAPSNGKPGSGDDDKSATVPFHSGELVGAPSPEVAVPVASLNPDSSYAS